MVIANCCSTCARNKVSKSKFCPIRSASVLMMSTIIANLNSMVKTNEDNGKKIDALIISMQKITDFTHFMFILAGIVGFTLGIAIAYFKP